MVKGQVMVIEGERKETGGGVGEYIGEEELDLGVLYEKDEENLAVSIMMATHTMKRVLLLPPPSSRWEKDRALWRLMRISKVLPVVDAVLTCVRRHSPAWKGGRVVVVVVLVVMVVVAVAAAAVVVVVVVVVVVAKCCCPRTSTLSPPER